MVLTRYEVEIPEFDHLSQELSDVTIELVDVRSDPRGQFHSILCVTGNSHESLTRAIAADPSIIDHRVLEFGGNRCLVDVELGTRSPSVEAYRLLTKFRGVLIKAISDGRHWQVTAYFSSSDEASSYFKRLEETSLRPLSISVESEHGVCEFRSGAAVTPPQREALILAIQRGYFSVPKETSLEQVASELGISQQALSERLRRGTRTLIEDAVLLEHHLA